MTQEIINSQKIQKIANLAKIEINKDQESHFVKQLENIISWFDKLDAVNVDEVKPLMNVNDSNLEMFEDEVSDGNIVDDILKNAPQPQYNFFAVPKVIE